MRRLRFVWRATRQGWLWLVEISNHLGAAALVLLALGISAFSAVKLPHWWFGILILGGLYVLLFAEGAFREWNRAERGRVEALERLGEGDPRRVLVRFLKDREAELPVLIESCASSAPRDARGHGDDWAGGISLRIIGYEPQLAHLFDDDGEVQFGSTQAVEFFERRRGQLRKVIAALEASGEAPGS